MILRNLKKMADKVFDWGNIFKFAKIKIVRVDKKGDEDIASRFIKGAVRELADEKKAKVAMKGKPSKVTVKVRKKV